MERTSPSPVDDPNAPPELGPREFERIRRLMETHTGVHLTEAKGALVMARLGRRLRELKLRSYKEYLAYLEAHTNAETAELVDRLLTNETRLFREGWQFEFLETTIVPQWRRESIASRSRRPHVWSAACSTGEEPASLAAVMETQFPAPSGPRVEILATDLSARALRAARTLSFPLARSRDIPPAYARQFEEADGDRIRLKAAASSLIRFEPMNLLTPTVAAASFDLVLCRNVLIYFTRETKRQVIGHMWRALKPGGYLFVGHAESLVGVIEGQRPLKPAIYRKPEAGAP